MRKYVAILMLVCANILLFAHSVVAHHHHEGAIVMFYSDGCESHDEHSHSDHAQYNHHNDNDHSHEHHSDLEDCNLSNITRPVKVQKQDINFALLYTTLHNFMLSELLGCDDEVIYGEYLEYNYHSPCIRFSGLRGPPTC